VISHNVGHLRAIVLLCSFIAANLTPSLTNQCAAQVPAPPSTSPPAESPAPNGEAKPSAQAPPVDANKTDKSENTDTKQEKEQKEQRRGSFVFAPLPIVSPAIGSGIVPVVAYIFPFQTRDENSPPSLVGVSGLITNNDTRAFALAGDIYFKQASYNLKSLYFRGNLDYNLYGVGYVEGNAGHKLPLEQTGQLFFIEFLRALPWKFYVGGRFITGNSLITVKATTGETPPIPADAGLDTQLRALGVTLTRDSRPNRFYPVEGSLIDFTGDFYAESLGSKYSFQSYNLTFNKYFSLPKKQVLAYNLFLCATEGEPPFYGNCIYGARNELRGYTAGRYLDRYMFATQLEYRLVLRWRLGVVGFGGIGGVARNPGDFAADQLLPGAGTGIRFMLSNKFHVNLRTDFAWGKDNFTWSMGVGEAF
jgi:Omp85 superfamily domain